MVATPYGRAPLLLLAAGLAALVLHLAVPMSTTWNDEESETYTRSEVAKIADDQSNWVTASGPGVTLVGAIVLLTAGALLFVPAFAPMGAGGARALGWIGGVAGVGGGFLAASSSFYWIGTMFSVWFSLANESAPEFYMVWSPILVGAAGAYGFYQALKVLQVIVPNLDGARERAADHHQVAIWALAFLGAVLAVPWSFHNPDGADNYRFFSADAIEQASSGEVWEGMAYGLGVFYIASWILVGLAVAGGSAGLMTRVAGTEPLRKLLDGAQVISGFLLFWIAILYVLAWSTWFKPMSGAENFQPGYFPVLVLLALIPLGMAVADVLRPLLRERMAAASRSVSFE